MGGPAQSVDDRHTPLIGVVRWCRSPSGKQGEERRDGDFYGSFFIGDGSR